jgi:hypothetical protein
MDPEVQEDQADLGDPQLLLVNLADQEVPSDPGAPMDRGVLEALVALVDQQLLLVSLVGLEGLEDLEVQGDRGVQIVETAVV